jgi:dephospho-CoA kinase
MSKVIETPPHPTLSPGGEGRCQPGVRRRLLVLGITGGIASGKSTVLRLLAKEGIPTADADELAHATLARGKPAYRAAVRRFGREILAKGGQIDRRKLGRIIFADPRKRRALEKMVHPGVIRELQRFIRSRSHGMLAVDIPLLFEAGLTRLVDLIVVVGCRLATQVERLLRRNKWSRAEALRRIRAQWPLKRKAALGDTVLQNDGGLPALRKQVKAFVRSLRRP